MSKLLTSLELVYKNVYSQNGEDGILEFIFWQLGIDKGYFVEFGAWDGIVFSNSCNLYRHKSWSGLLIEIDPERYQNLIRNVSEYHVKTACLAITPENINQVFDEQMVPHDFDLLSIDIDGNDYAVWQSLEEKYKPKIVIIEPCFGRQKTSNPMDGDGVEGKRISAQGTNVLPIIELGNAKGYDLLEHNGGNVIMIRSDLFQALGYKNPIDIKTRFRRYHWSPNSNQHGYDYLSS